MTKEKRKKKKKQMKGKGTEEKSNFILWKREQVKFEFRMSTP